MRQEIPILERAVPSVLLRWEGVLVWLVAWALLAAIPVSLGELGLGWDDLNHHVYLGWAAAQHRFDLDFLGAGYQSFQWPYLYWPLYEMAAAGMSGPAAGVVLASLQALAVVPVWMLARACAPGQASFDIILRVLGTALALLSGIVLSAFDATMDDLLAAIPLVWGVAFAMQPIARDEPVSAARRHVLLSGLCTGLAAAFKLSNGPLAIGMPVLWLLSGRAWRDRLHAVLLGSFGTTMAFLAGYGYWGWLLWRHFGNPVFPFYHHWFAPMRAALGWAG